ncbi:hypothetical protein AaE_009796, partial [Aphanomyces astaci]
MNSSSALPSLSKQDKDRITTIALAAAHELIRHANVDASNDHIQWTLQRHQADLDMYEGVTVPSPAKKSPTLGLFCSVTHVSATLDEVIGLQNSPTTLSQRDVVAVPLYTILPQAHLQQQQSPQAHTMTVDR